MGSQFGGLPQQQQQQHMYGQFGPFMQQQPVYPHYGGSTQQPVYNQQYYTSPNQQQQQSPLIRPQPRPYYPSPPAPQSHEATSRTLHESALIAMHEQWMVEHERTYANDTEKKSRFEIFKNNLNYIDKFNHEKPNRTYKLGINRFADLTYQEFRRYFTGFKVPSGENTNNDNSFKYQNLTLDNIPTSVDWRKKGAVTAVKNQGQCASCWAFSAVAAVEAITQIRTGKLVSLSEQQLLDCVSKNDGCNTGFMEYAFEYIIQNNGITTETNYPYEGGQSSCDTAAPAAKITGYERVPQNNEDALLKAVSQQPVSVGIEETKSLQFYDPSSGIYTGDDCGGGRSGLRHALTLVGYGEENGTKYWLAKNSWGTKWGDNGYVKFLRGGGSPQGVCQINTYASYPIA
ncbi:ervatamin-B-like [Humulus lupulus]|uniref:ervatamin-B-like n=1 Tax=Humulus lupulus TaxID=3486 RepID=UPI002B40E9A5|nr:ervatamin-B-like [Humulus lupulus]